MKLSTILTHARARELSSISKLAKTDEVIITYINLALVELYSKFQLATGEAIITLRPDIPKTIYSMTSTDNDVKVEGNPITDLEFMSIIEAYDENGDSVPVNDDNNEYSIFTTSYNQIQIPLLAEHGYISVIYRKNPKLIEFTDDGNGNATDTDVEIPLQLLNAVLHHIGYSAQIATNGEGNAESSAYYAEFLKACEDAKLLGILPIDGTTGTCVQDKGFL